MQPDWRLRQLAQSSVNFGFLLDDEPLLLSYGAAAEAYESFAFPSELSSDGRAWANLEARMGFGGVLASV